MLKRQPAITLIVSIFNQEWFAPYLLPSIAAQRCTVPFEVIFCDDGSTDTLFDKIRAFTTEFRLSTKYLWQHKDGFRLSSSRNNAIRSASSDLLIFVDGDMCLAPTFLEDHLREHCGNPTLVCGSRISVLVSNDSTREHIENRINRASEIQTSPERERQENWLKSEHPWMACIGGNFSAPKSSELMFDEAFVGWGSEDRDLSLRLFRNNHCVKLLPHPNAVHIRRRYEPRLARHAEVVAFLRGKLLLRNKYPNGEMSYSLELACCCRHDSATNLWSFGARRTNVTADMVLNDFEAWYEGHPEPCLE